MSNYKPEYLKLKQKILGSKFSRMNNMQKQAVFTVKGPLLILAGAGSGKTTVLVNRIAYMIHYGDIYWNEPDNITQSDVDALKSVENDTTLTNNELGGILKTEPINPWNILAITFTNKAARELKDRLSNILGEDGDNVNAGTFHYICLRILRREIDKLGFKSSFTIYDTDDSLRVVKECLKELNIEEKMFPSKSVFHEISNSKDSLIEPKEYLEAAEQNFRKQVVGKVFDLYQKKLRLANAVDFDDIICLTVKLFEQFPDVLNHYQNLYKYVLVDEYQDTNYAQYRLVSLLSDKHQNLCVVGDDDQSIYRFRGATIANILNFEQEFKNATVIRLEQNYRSTQNILDAANNIIKKNEGRKGKNLWTENGTGEKVQIVTLTNEEKESNFVVSEIESSVSAGKKFSDHCILYRMNAQSAVPERNLIRAGIPYRIFGGKKFFDRKEVKDMLAYLQIIANPSDIVRLRRIVNTPTRGIGEVTLNNLLSIAEQLAVNPIEAMKMSPNYTVVRTKSKPLTEFAEMIDDFKDKALFMPLYELIDEVAEKTGYLESLKKEGVEGETRMENIAELKSYIQKYEEDNEEATLDSFLEEVSLYTDLDNMNDDDDRVTLMTIHAAKGLEFPIVFIVGAEENIFPSYLSMSSDEEMEEERRLAYVAVTRAKEKLYVTNAVTRTLFGKTDRNEQSRFLKDVPDEVCEREDKSENDSYSSPSYGSYGQNNSYYGRGVNTYHVDTEQYKKPVKKPVVSSTVNNKEKAVIDYVVGDRVSHKVFGEGTIKSMTKMGSDTLVEVDFSKVGTKKIMANFAKLQKL